MMLAPQFAMANILNQNAQRTEPFQDFFQFEGLMPRNISSQRGAFSVIFRASGASGQASAPIMVQCMPDEKVSEVIGKK